jgi:hypothetical protein
VLLRLGYPAVSNAFGILRLLSMRERDKDVEILALRHQIAVLERQLGKQRVRFTSGDRAFLAALLHRLPRQVLRRLRLVVRPDTVLHWYRDLIARRRRTWFSAWSRPCAAGVLGVEADPVGCRPRSGSRVRPRQTVTHRHPGNDLSEIGVL